MKKCSLNPLRLFAPYPDSSYLCAMQDIFIHLTYLLTEHDCVSIPGFGGFVVHRDKAQHVGQEGIFTPPTYTIGFNEQLKHNDGLLINSLMQTEETDYKTAQRSIDLFVGDIKRSLDENNAISFPGVGKISVSVEGNYQFTPFKETAVNASMFGFSDFHLPLLSELQAVPFEQETSVATKKDKDTLILIPVSKRFVQTIASAAAIIILFLMVSTPIDNASIPAQYASVIDSGLISSPTLQPKALVRPEVNKQIAIGEPAVKEQPTSTKQVPATPIVQKIPEQQATSATPIAEQKKSSDRTYYIIVAGTPSKAKATRILSDIRTKLSPQADIIEKNELSRIYVAKFSNKREAEQYLDSFRQEHPQYKDAWLLSVR